MKVLLSFLIGVLGAVIVYAAFSSPGGPAWFHVLGMGVSVLALLIIWLFPSSDQPKGPPP